ncbi:MAG TPA: type IV pilus modification protein PilV [Rhodanobacteraceae bacterium]|nr:type IV pilus modification protein PilV [Rhodanobacteraceae bacterium]
MSYQPRRHRGLSLIEVLVAVLIFSIGLIGLAGLLVMSTQANHGAFVRTQATVLSQNLADRMRSNVVGLWQGNYDGTYTAVTGAPACDSTAPCKPQDLATRDRIQWRQLLGQYLPNDGNLAATVDCDPAVNVSAYARVRPPYNGTCTLNITWTERSLGLTGSPTAQTFAWTFQP